MANKFLTALMFVLISTSAVFAEDMAVEQVGFTGLTRDIKPVLTIRIGNPTLGEKAAVRNGLDGRLWTPVRGTDHWLLSNRRNHDKAEAETGDRWNVIRSTHVVGPPPILEELDPELLALVEFVMMYDEGGTRIMLRPGTSQIEAGMVVLGIDEHLDLVTGGNT